MMRLARQLQRGRRLFDALVPQLVAASALAATASCDNDDATQATLDRLYSGLPDGHDIPISESRQIDESGGHEAYGELTTRGVRELHALLMPTARDVFYDFGSGVN